MVPGGGNAASVGTHSQFKGLIKQRVKVLLVLLGLPGSQLRELVPGLQGQLDKGVAGTWQVAQGGNHGQRYPSASTSPRSAALPPPGSPEEMHPVLLLGRQSHQGRESRAGWPVGSLRSPLESRGSRLEALSSSTRSFCSEAW